MCVSGAAVEVGDVEGVCVGRGSVAGAESGSCWEV